VERVKRPRVRNQKKRIEELRNKAKEHNQDEECAIVSVDEFGPIELKPEKGSNWAEEKHPDRVPADYNRFGGVRHLLSAYDLGKDKLYAHVKKHKTHVEFLAFLKYLRSLYPFYVMVYVILDNFSPHTVPRVHEYAEASNMEFAFTPTNASWLNPIEAHFGPLRKFAVSNSNPKSHKEIATNIRRYIAWRNKHRPAPPNHGKRIKKVKPHLCAKCGINILEWH
jgi:transposase